MIGCVDCSWSIPIEIESFTVDADTGEVIDSDGQPPMDGAPDCPRCGGEVEYEPDDGGDR